MLMVWCIYPAHKHCCVNQISLILSGADWFWRHTHTRHTSQIQLILSFQCLRICVWHWYWFRSYSLWCQQAKTWVKSLCHFRHKRLISVCWFEFTCGSNWSVRLAISWSRAYRLRFAGIWVNYASMTMQIFFFNKTITKMFCIHVIMHSKHVRITWKRRTTRWEYIQIVKTKHAVSLFHTHFVISLCISRDIRPKMSGCWIFIGK